MTTSYALRDRNTGRFVRIETVSNGDADNCTAERCTLVAENRDLPRFEVPTLGDLLSAMRFDEKWYNSSPERPSHGRVRMEDCIPFRFDLVEVYDETGGDAVSSTTTAVPARIPPRYGAVLPILDRPDPDAMAGAFGAQAWEAIVEDWSQIASVDPSEGGTPMPGMLLLTDRNNLLQITHVVEDPAAPAGRLLVACSGKEIVEMPEEAFVRFDDDVSPSL